MSRARQQVVRALDALRLKRPVRAGLNLVLRAGGFPLIGVLRVFGDVERLVARPRPRPAAERGRILFVSLRGWSAHIALEGLFAEAAAQRGFTPTFFTCGGPLPLCGITNFRAADPTPCADCFGFTSRLLNLFGFPVETLSDLVGEADREEARLAVERLRDDELESFVHEELPLGAMTRISVLWFLLRGLPGPGGEWTATYRKFLVAAILVRRALERVLDRVRPDRVVTLNGLFFAERILLELAARKGIRIVTYERAFMPQTWIFGHTVPVVDYGIRAAFLAGGDVPLTPAQDQRLETYLEERRRGGSDVAQYWPSLETRTRVIAEELGLDPSRAIVSAFTNITWDSAVQDKDIAFDGMFGWLADTVRHFAAQDRAQLVIRIHPAEVRLKGLESSDRVLDTLERRIGKLPPSVKVVPPESTLSSYVLGEMSRYVIVYSTTLGMELAIRGQTVVVAGETHFRGYGFTVDVERETDYGALLDRLGTGELPRPDVARARRYAYYFLFRYMIPIPFLGLNPDGHPRIALESFEDLLPGRDPTVDLILDGMLEGRQFFLPS